MKKSISTFAAVLTALLTACAQPEVPAERFYRLQIQPPEASLPQPGIQGVVEVTFTAEGIVDDRNINYSKAETPNEVSGYTYRLWHKPPKVMLRDQLIAYLRAAGVAQKVVAPEKRASPQYLINGQIKRLEMIDGSVPHAIVALELALVEARTDKLLTLGVYDVSVTARSNAVADAVAAMEKALADIFAKFVEDIKKM